MVDVVTDNKGSREVREKAIEKKALKVANEIVNDKNITIAHILIGAIIIFFLTFSWFLFSASWKSKQFWMGIGKRQVQREAIDYGYGEDGTNGFRWIGEIKE